MKTLYLAGVDPFHKWMPNTICFVSIKISLTNLIFELIAQSNFYFLLSNEFSEANLNTYTRILNWQLFMKRLYTEVIFQSLMNTYMVYLWI